MHFIYAKNLLRDIMVSMHIEIEIHLVIEMLFFHRPEHRSTSETIHTLSDYPGTIDNSCCTRSHSPIPKSSSFI